MAAIVAVVVFCVWCTGVLLVAALLRTRRRRRLRPVHAAIIGGS